MNGDFLRGTAAGICFGIAIGVEIMQMLWSF